LRTQLLGHVVLVVVARHLEKQGHLMSACVAASRRQSVGRCAAKPVEQSHSRWHVPDRVRAASSIGH
jgi:hypothetical protein